ncbi:CBS domain-containing protein [Alginatibacterium sediminis]|uniref:CBS domain-containing protein n=1 Tax=Alginatibacterium sediminis TaxID=2164068 RepID=A0A420ELK0_9ALTE|nr:CBS domain-containing protein [Alginatibacterium sediminis]RKF21520.1 CBS domain-containing protein [Alginatibacterium sediminis]
MKELKVSHYMNRSPISFQPEQPVAAIVESLNKHALIGGPVLDSEGLVIGWISQQDCLHQMLQSTYHCEQTALASDVMRKDVLLALPDTSIVELAEQMLQQKPKSYPVVEAGKLVGVIDRHAVLKAISEHQTSC